MERVLRASSCVKRRVQNVFKDRKFLISKKRSVATRKLNGTCFSERMFRLDKKKKKKFHYPIRQIFNLIAAISFPFSALPRTGWNFLSLVFTDLSAV